MRQYVRHSELSVIEVLLCDFTERNGCLFLIKGQYEWHIELEIVIM